ncbi:MAG TPA: four helix bundle protein [Vicinamibacterales bacterium]|nr:four helix bundle protein [Vicinamibacterales bacterium]
MGEGTGMAKKIEDLPVYQHALKFCDAVDAILQRPALRRNRRLWDQIAEANDSILSNMKEGFEQSSDDGFANMLTYSKGSCAEIVARLWRAHRRRCLTSEEYDAQRRMAEELQRMLGGFIKYLRATGFKDRGSYRAKHPAPGPAPTPPAPNPVDPDPPKR